MFLYPPTPCQAGAGACATAKHFPQLAIARHQACAKTLARHQAHGKAFARHQARPKPWPSLCARAASDALLFMHLAPQKGALSLPCTCSLFPWIGFGASFWTFPRPVLWSCKLAKAWPKIRTPRFQPRDGSVFGAFLVRFGAPCRCVSPF